MAFISFLLGFASIFFSLAAPAFISLPWYEILAIMLIFALAAIYTGRKVSGQSSITQTHRFFSKTGIILGKITLGLLALIGLLIIVLIIVNPHD